MHKLEIWNLKSKKKKFKKIRWNFFKENLVLILSTKTFCTVFLNSEKRDFFPS